MNQSAPSTETTERPVLAVTGDQVPVCRCGQDLDMARGTSCPRCGAPARATAASAA